MLLGLLGQGVASAFSSCDSSQINDSVSVGDCHEESVPVEDTSDCSDLLHCSVACNCLLAGSSASTGVSSFVQAPASSSYVDAAADALVFGPAGYRFRPPIYR